MKQLATVAPVPCAEIRAAEVRRMYRERFPHEWVAVEVMVEASVQAHLISKSWPMFPSLHAARST